MSTPDIATRLLLATDEAMGEEVRALAQQLDGENVRRQEEEAEIVAAAKRIVQTDPDVGARTVLVVAGDGWHRGVIGIVASKLVDAFHRPAIVLSVEDGVAHGSCRSVPHFDMLSALERCAPLFVRFGGHKQAAGLTMDASRIKELRSAINDVADETLGPNELMPRLRIDGDLAFRGITGGVAAAVASLAPFGAGNPRPVFSARGVEIVDGPRKLKERHLKMALASGRTHFQSHRLAGRRAARLPHRAQRGPRRRVLAGAESIQRRDVRRVRPSPTSGDRNPESVKALPRRTQRNDDSRGNERISVLQCRILVSVSSVVRVSSWIVRYPKSEISRCRSGRRQPGRRLLWWRSPARSALPRQCESGSRQRRRGRWCGRIPKPSSNPIKGSRSGSTRTRKKFASSTRRC